MTDDYVQTSTKIKICGMSREEDMEAINTYPPDFCGFVFAPGSRRRVSLSQAGKLSAMRKKGITAVGVFVDAPVDLIGQAADSKVIDMIQLHGHEDESYLTRLRKITTCKIIQAVTIRTLNDIIRARSSSADYILLDNGSGSGQTFQWDLLEKAEKTLGNGIGRKYFLAGGLSPENLTEAISRFHPYAVDISSGVESYLEHQGAEPVRVKDPLKIRRCVEIARSSPGQSRNSINKITPL